MNYPDGDSKSYALYRRAQGCLPGGNTRTTVFMKPYPIYVARGSGCRVWDVDGTERIDCVNNFTAAIHGYAHPALVEAANAQLQLGTAFGLPTVSEIELAELLCERVKSIQQCRFLNSGTEAVMMAIKAARAVTGRPKIAKCEGAYHGTYDYAEVSLDTPREFWTGGQPPSIAYARGTPAGVTDDVLILPFNDVDTAVAILREHRNTVAGILIDPLPNRAGLIPAEREYLLALRETAADIGALTIFDEVISFRLGYSGSQALWRVDADVTVLGKIIGGGFPIGAVGGSREIMDVFDPSNGKPPLPQGGTFSGNPMSMRCGMAAMALLNPDAFRRLESLGQRVRNGIDQAFRSAGVIGQTTGMGSLLKVHLNNRTLRDYRTSLPTPDEAKRLTALVRSLLNEGVLIASNGLLALSTPMTDQDIDLIIESFQRAIARGLG